jgi:hypothetical protein
MAAARDVTPFATALATSWHARTRSLLEAGAGVCVADYELDEGPALSPLVERVRELVEHALGLLQEIATTLEDEPPPTMAEVDLFDEVERRLDQRGDVGHRIGGLCFVARGVLQARRRALGELGVPLRTWDVVTVCSQASREVQKSLAALDVALAEMSGESPSDAYATETEVALRTRRAYARFRADILSAPADRPLAGRLRFAGTAIAKLVGRSIYASARVHDRWMLRRLQGQIRAFLADRGAPLDDPERVATGDRLLQEVENVSQLMMQINHRAELLAHDGKQLEALAAAAAEGQSVASLEALRAPLFGRSASLDALTADDGPTRWREVVEGVRREVGVRMTLAPPRTGRPRPPPADEDIDWSGL